MPALLRPSVPGAAFDESGSDRLVLGTFLVNQNVVYFGIATYNALCGFRRNSGSETRTNAGLVAQTLMRKPPEQRHNAQGVEIRETASTSVGLTL